VWTNETPPDSYYVMIFFKLVVDCLHRAAAKVDPKQTHFLKFKQHTPFSTTHDLMSITLILIRNAIVYAPELIGKRDVLIGGEKILAIDETIELPSSSFLRVIDADGMFLTPGLIDPHVHIAGGGGEGGFATRTPELSLSDATKFGVTTVVGLLGTDGTTRHHCNLLAKARSLEAEGLSTYILTGSYQLPSQTLTGSIQSDIINIDKIIGVGEVAIADHRSSEVSVFVLLLWYRHGFEK
jgi:beta-aspartyl-dipeptidase (metallo-type)